MLRPCCCLMTALLCACAATSPVTPFRYDNGPDDVREGLYRVVDREGRMGFADESGRVVIAPRFAFAFPFQNGRARVTDRGQRRDVPGSGGEYGVWDSPEWYVIDRSGTRLD